MERLERIKRQRAWQDAVLIGVLAAAFLLVGYFIGWSVNQPDDGYKYSEYNYHMCVEVYGLNEDCE